MKYQKVNIEKIDIKSPCWDRFTIAFKHESEELLESIKHFSLINPIQVWEKSAMGEYWLLSGYKRLLAVSKLGWEKVPAMVYAKNELTEENALQVALLKIYYGAPPSDGEKAFFLAKMSSCFNFKSRKIAEKCSHYLKLPPSETLIEDYINIGNLSKRWLTSLHFGNLSLEQIRSLLSFKRKDRDVLLRLLDKEIALNRNESLLFFEIVKDLSFIKKCSIEELLKEPEMKKIYKNEKLHKKKRGEELLSFLKRLRYPQIHQAAEEFQQNLKKAELPDRVQVHHPSDFEGGSLRFVIDSPGERELAQQLDDIQKSIAKGKITPLFKYI